MLRLGFQIAENLLKDQRTSNNRKVMFHLNLKGINMVECWPRPSRKCTLLINLARDVSLCTLEYRINGRVRIIGGGGVGNGSV